MLVKEIRTKLATAIFLSLSQTSLVRCLTAG